MVNRLRTDQDYIDAGVEPPEHIRHGDSTIKLDDHVHLWKARGPYIECNKGQHVHGTSYDHLNTVLVGTSNEGKPLFKPIVLANQAELDAEAKKQL